MLIFTRSLRMCLAVDPVDLRKSFDGLAAQVQHSLEEDERSSQVFVFTNKRRDRVRMLYWDGTGIWLLTNSDAPQCALWFSLQYRISVSPAFWERIRNFRFGRW